MMSVLSFVCIFVAVAFSVEGASLGAASSPSRIVCYVGTWANYRNGAGKFVIEDIDPFLCTHVVYAFAKLAPNNEIAAYDPYLDLKENNGLGGYERFVGLKKKNSNLKLLLAIGGWNEGSVKYSNMAAKSRKTFVSSCVNFLKKYGFDGLDVDWEYPANRGGSSADKSNFVTLLQDLKEAFQPQGLLLTAAVSAAKTTIDTAYDIPGISKYLDFINLVSYNYNGAWNAFTGHNAPLVGRQGRFEDSLNVEFAVKYWIERGTPPHKLVLCMPLHGRTFTLKDPNRNGVGSPATGKGLSGPYTKQNGYIGYNELCEMFKYDNSWKIVFDQEQKVPYAYKGNQWLSYDNVESIAMKVDFIKKYKLGGAMVCSMETDDFQGNCNGGKHPLINTIKKGLKQGNEDRTNDIFITGNENVTNDIPTTTTTATMVPGRRRRSESTVVGRGSELCTTPGHAHHPQTCRKFIVCLQLHVGYYMYVMDCPPGTVYSKKTGICDFPRLVPECN